MHTVSVYNDTVEFDANNGTNGTVFILPADGEYSATIEDPTACGKEKINKFSKICSMMHGYTVDRGIRQCVKMTLSASAVIAKHATKCTLPTTHGQKGLLIHCLSHCC